MHRVVITGLGVVSPLGCGTELAWSRLIAGRSGLRRLPEAIVADLACKVGAMVPSINEDPEGGFDPDRYMPHREQRRVDRFIQLAIAAADEAIAQSGWSPQTESERQRTGTIIASGVGGFPVIVDATRVTDNQGVKRLSPFTIPSLLVNLAAGQVSIRHGLKGPLGAPVTACAASVQAIGDAARLIRTGEADVIVAGGAEACIHTVSFGGFAAARALSTQYNDTPMAASRPFDEGRDGFVMGEGAACLVLESWEHATARGATILAEVLGYGTSADAHHVTAAPENGEGAQRAMRMALAQSGLAPEQIGYLNAHSTSTPVGDRGELNAIRAVFGSGAGPAISSTKSATGHLLGAAGALEAVFTILALRDGILPPTLNLQRPDAAAEGLDLIGAHARRTQAVYGLSNGFGFGGVNASVIFAVAKPAASEQT
ncbi:beta-ketoacyl-[acyl-carrier-protein] synthase II [Brevundimonas naejangsanensis]|uniref:3-oxoacyl-[acyl-carrier-protein] synthase 2 n=1 Tax=Brevundimonas naejangsanensis TaxID=588932 RepID=A0A494RH83_9CAUL|nr:beta-ketoacyl-ACP synthase II [Brevundimonas naejangsanensis]AYG95778.1 beta-ketoacyl-[acyl-carrier-protein] synthase II [Brevundimonas naejangsanensis]